jgi:integrase/recombinase XerD
MREKYEAFVRARRYTKGVSKRTEGWYWQSWKAYESVLAEATPETLSKSVFTTAIEDMLSREVSPITINTYGRAINAFLHWLSAEGYCSKPITIPRLKEPEVVIPTLKPEQVQRLLQHRPTCQNHRRAQMLALVILDTGLRLKEGLSLRRDDIDLDNLLLTVRDGKGGKQRVVPFTTELRKALFKYMDTHKAPNGLIFYAGCGAKLLQNNIRRDFNSLCKKLRINGAKGGFHFLRHTMALNYVRNAGDVFRLQRILGHSTLEMTRRYVTLQTADLQAVHERLSMLSHQA